MGKRDHDDMLHLSVTMGAVLLYSHLLRTPETEIHTGGAEDEKEDHNSSVKRETEVHYE